MGQPLHARRQLGVASMCLAAGPTLEFEQRAWRCGHGVVAGVDEAGRGAWAGPLVAAAAIVPRESVARAKLTRALNRAGVRVDDSKQLTASQRETIVDIMDSVGVRYRWVAIDVQEIDRLGVGIANRRALALAAKTLPEHVDHLLVDGFPPLEAGCSFEAIVGGDARSLSIALASIVAKVQRDRLMVELDVACPGYSFGVHKGYGTKLHAEALDRLGVSMHHRSSFAPIAARLTRHGQ